MLESMRGMFQTLARQDIEKRSFLAIQRSCGAAIT